MDRDRALALVAGACARRAAALEGAGFHEEAEELDRAMKCVMAAKLRKPRAPSPRGEDGKFTVLRTVLRTVDGPSHGEHGGVFSTSLCLGSKDLQKQDKAETGSFESFYVDYPRKENKKAAESAWRKLSKADRAAAMAGLERFRREVWPEMERQFIPHPASWLNKRRWEDERGPPPISRARAVMEYGKLLKEEELRGEQG